LHVSCFCWDKGKPNKWKFQELFALFIPFGCTRHHFDFYSVYIKHQFALYRELLVYHELASLDILHNCLAVFDIDEVSLIGALPFRQDLNLLVFRLQMPRFGLVLGRDEQILHLPSEAADLAL